jgi:hypothetical protein
MVLFLPKFLAALLPVRRWLSTSAGISISESQMALLIRGATAASIRGSKTAVALSAAHKSGKWWGISRHHDFEGDDLTT